MPLRFPDPSPEAYHFDLTIDHILRNGVNAASDQPIIYREASSYGYAELSTRVGRLASLLAAAGAEQGMTIAVMDWDSHRYLEAYFAIPMMGAVLMTVNVRLTAPQIAYTLGHANAEILLVHRDFLPILEAIRPSLPHIRSIILLDDDAGKDMPDYVIGEYEALSAAASPDFPFERLDENAVATTFYTTGTTGSPKGVSFTHRQLVLHTLATIGPFGNSKTFPGIGVGDVYMPLTPMFHVHAWGVPYIATMLGLKQVYPGRYEPAMICRLRERHGVTYSHCVPTVANMVFEAADAAGVDLSGWRMTVGGSVLTKELHAEGRQRNVELLSGYGMSETCPIVAMARRPHGTADLDTVTEAETASGHTTPLVTARLVDSDMNFLPHDGQTRGELVLRAPWLTLGYTGDRAGSEALWKGGWLHTQDVATIDPNGVIRIRDRIKDVIKSGGEWISSLDLEQLILKHESVAEAAVVAVPDDRWGERPLAVVVLKAGMEVTLDDLNVAILEAIAAGTITRFARLDRFRVVEGLPKTSVGKIDKKLIRDHTLEMVA